MNYKVKKAFDLIVPVYIGWVDKANNPYILHLYRVYENANNDDERTVALLHDIIEDGLIEYDDLVEIFNKEIADAVYAISRKENERYFDYIKRVKEVELAKKVKILDLLDNLKKERLDLLDYKTRLGLRSRYEKAIKILSE